MTRWETDKDETESQQKIPPQQKESADQESEQIRQTQQGSTWEPPMQVMTADEYYSVRRLFRNGPVIDQRNSSGDMCPTDSTEKHMHTTDADCQTGSTEHQTRVTSTQAEGAKDIDTGLDNCCQSSKTQQNDTSEWETDDLQIQGLMRITEGLMHMFDSELELSKVRPSTPSPTTEVTTADLMHSAQDSTIKPDDSFSENTIDKSEAGNSFEILSLYQHKLLHHADPQCKANMESSDSANKAKLDTECSRSSNSNLSKLQLDQLNSTRSSHKVEARQSASLSHSEVHFPVSLRLETDHLEKVKVHLTAQPVNFNGDGHLNSKNANPARGWRSDTETSSELGARSVCSSEDGNEETRWSLFCNSLPPISQTSRSTELSAECDPKNEADNPQNSPTDLPKAMAELQERLSKITGFTDTELMASAAAYQDES